MEAQIRGARMGDEEALAYIQTESWKHALRHVLVPGTLERCTDIDRAVDMYRRPLEERKGNGYVLLLDGRPHCIAWWDGARDAELDGKAELICIHSLPDNWRRGYGRAMMERVFADMRAGGFSEAVLRVFSDNTGARGFYEAMGFHAMRYAKKSLGAREVCYLKRL